MIKNKLIKILVIQMLALFIAMPVCFAENSNVVDLTPKTKTEKKSELNNVLKKFAKSMGLVIGSCVSIYILLIVYKKFRKNGSKENYNSSLANNLNTPETTDEAIKLVIEKF